MMNPDGTWKQDIQCIVSQQNGKGAIYISNLQVACNPLTLKKYNIGAVITAIAGKNLDEKIPKHIQYLYIPVNDHVSCDISVYFKMSYDFIQEQRQRTNVLVHCMAGVSRSVTLVIAYLMQKSQISYQTAYEFVKSRRSIIHPNDSFIKQLKKLQLKLKMKTTGKQEVKERSFKQIQNHEKILKGLSSKNITNEQLTKEKIIKDDMNRTKQNSTKEISMNYDEKLRSKIKKLFTINNSKQSFYSNNLLLNR